MSRDLFAQTLTQKKTPARSKWVIAGSAVAHVIVGFLVIAVPLLSALDDFVIQARSMVYVPPPSIPVMPAAPPANAAAAPQLNKDAAPTVVPDEPVSTVAPPVTSSGPPAPGPLVALGPGGSGVVGVPGATGRGDSVTLARPPQPPVQPVRPGVAIKEPVRTTYVAPVYPRLAVVTKTEGAVILEATIDEHGVVRNVRVLRSIPLLDPAAVEAVSQWRYSATMLNGTAVPILLTVTVTFKVK